MKKEQTSSTPKLMQFVDMAMKEAQRNSVSPSKNDPLISLVERVVRQAEKVRGLVEVPPEPLPVLPSLARRRLTFNELKALAALIGHQAANTGFPSPVIKMAVELWFDVDDVSELTGAQFDDAVHYLVYFHENEILP